MPLHPLSMTKSTKSQTSRGQSGKHGTVKITFSQIWNRFRYFPFHPILLAIYAILFFLDHNLAQVDVHAADRLLIYFSMITLGLLLLTALVFRNLQQAGFLVFSIVVLFFTYPHIKLILQQKFLISVSNYVLLPALCILLLGIVIVLFRISPQKAATLTFTFNLITFILAIIQLSLIFSYEIRVAASRQDYPLSTSSQTMQTVDGTLSLPDIYFIVLDGYARSDVLLEKYGLDNSDFLAKLQARHFYVAECSMSNYSNTEESLASTLNMMYVNDIVNQIDEIRYWEAAFLPYIQNNLARQYLETLGYQTVSFYTGYFWAEWRNATYFLGDPRVARTDVKSLIPFEREFLSLTLLRYLPDMLGKLGLIPSSQITDLTSHESARAIVQYTLDELPVVARMKGPKFVFAHLMLPHPPYVFDQKGGPQDPAVTDSLDIEMLQQGYHDQLLYANQRLLPILDAILEETKGNVIILLEGDHGVVEPRNAAERMKNLSAYYFPDQDYSTLHPTITPVNDFRVIFSQFFNQLMPLLEDQSYFQSSSSDKNLELIPNPCPSE